MVITEAKHNKMTRINIKLHCKRRNINYIKLLRFIAATIQNFFLSCFCNLRNIFLVTSMLVYSLFCSLNPNLKVIV